MDDSKARGPCDSKSNSASRESMKLSKGSSEGPHCHSRRYKSPRCLSIDSSGNPERPVPEPV